MSRRILVTAATGTVGSATMRCLQGDAEAGRITLLGAARSETSANRLRDSGFVPVVFDYDRPETFLPALEGVDSVFLITGYTVDMMIHSKRLLDAAWTAGVRHVVHLGALAAPDTPHAHFAWHQMVERVIEQMGFSHTHLQPNFFIDTVWAGYRRRPERLVHFIGEQRVSWIAADDIAAVAAAALRDPERHRGKSYQLAVEALSFPQIARLLSEITGRRVEYLPRPAAELLEILLKQGMDPVYAASLAAGIAGLEAGLLPLADTVTDTVEIVTGRKPINWHDFAMRHKTDLPAP